MLVMLTIAQKLKFFKHLFTIIIIYLLHFSPLGFPIQETALIDLDAREAKFLKLTLAGIGSLTGPSMFKSLYYELLVVRDQDHVPAGQDEILCLLARQVKSVLLLKLSAGHLESFAELGQGNVVAPRDFPVVLQLLGVPDIDQERSAFTEQGCQLLKSYNTHGRVHSTRSARKLRNRSHYMYIAHPTPPLHTTIPGVRLCQNG